MAAGGADRLAGDIKPWTDNMPGFDGCLDAPVGAASVAHRREAAVEHGAQSRRRARGDQSKRQHLHEADIDLAVDGVHVAVDQARHQRTLATVAHRRIRRFYRRLADFPNRIALAQQLMPAQKLATSKY